MNLQGFLQNPARFRVGEAKGVVDFSGLLPENSVYQTDGKNGIGVRVVVALLQLIGVKLAAIEDDSLQQALVGRQLHLDIVDRPRTIDGLDVKNGQLIVLEILQVEGVGKRDLDDRRAGIENRIQQADQGNTILWGPERAFERIIISGADSKRHNSLLVSEKKGEVVGTSSRTGASSTKRTNPGWSEIGGEILGNSVVPRLAEC